MSAERQCGLSSLLPMSCRNSAEAFARRLQSQLRKLGTPGAPEDSEQDENSWLSANTGTQQGVTNHQPKHHDTDAFYDFGLDSPGSPVDELTESEVSRLIAVNGKKEPLPLTHDDECQCDTKNTSELESGYICASPISEATPDSESSDGQYYDPESSESELKSCITSDNDDTLMMKKNVVNLLLNGFHNPSSLDIEIKKKSSKLIKSSSYNSQTEIELSSDSLPPSQTSDDVTPLSQSSTTIPSLTPNSVESHSSWTLEDDDSSTNLPEDCSVELKTNSLHQNEPNDKSIEAEVNGYDIETLHIDCELDTKEYTNTNNDMITRNEIDEIQHVPNGSDETDDICSNFEIKCDIDIITHCDPPVIEQQEEIPEAIVITEIPPDETDNSHLTVQDVLEASVLDNEENDDTDVQPRVRRSSSLRTGKTPPGTPGRKKIVRFADVFGLDLANVRTFLDDIPKIPSSAYEDLPNADLFSERSKFPSPFTKQKPDRCLVPLFQQPGGQPNFLDKVRERQVCLENAAVNDPIMPSIIGCVRVRNLDFHKSVYIRYSLDAWKTYADLQATYVMNSCDGFSDKFTFVLFVHTMAIGQRLEFAVRYHCKGSQYWDNNLGANYCFQCLPSTTPTYSPITSRVESSGAWNDLFY